jgi:hypothetical protein
MLRRRAIGVTRIIFWMILHPAKKNDPRPIWTSQPLMQKQSPHLKVPLSQHFGFHGTNLNFGLISHPNYLLSMLMQFSAFLFYIHQIRQFEKFGRLQSLISRDQTRRVSVLEWLWCDLVYKVKQISVWLRFEPGSVTAEQAYWTAGQHRPTTTTTKRRRKSLRHF